MKQDPKVVAKLSAEAKEAKKHAEEAIKNLQSTSAAGAVAADAYIKALEKIKLDNEIKESDFNNFAKSAGVLQKALKAENKSHISVDASIDHAVVAVEALFSAKDKK